MSLSKYSKRRGQFEALEAKQLFAADLVGGAAADLPDTAIVAEIDMPNWPARISMPSELEMTAGDDQQVCAADVAVIDPADVTNSLKVKDFTVDNIKNKDFTVEQNLASNLGGQEGEDIARQLTGNLTKGAPWAEHNIGTTIGGQEGEPIIDTDSSNQWLGQLHHIKPHGSAGSYSDYPEITDQHMRETTISKRDQAYSIVGFQDTNLHLSHLDYQSLGGQEGEDFTAGGFTGDSATIAAVDSVFSMGTIRTPMTADTSGIGTVDVSGIAAVDTCGLSQGAFRLI